MKKKKEKTPKKTQELNYHIFKVTNIRRASMTGYSPVKMMCHLQMGHLTHPSESST